MPKKTFYNLPDDKKQKIVDAAYNLFINNEYNNVSIRALSKNADISIGSFYQYFDDKDELYLYLIYEIENKIYSREKENINNFIYKKKVIPINEICTEKEVKFNDTLATAPIEVLQKFYFGGYVKKLDAFYMDELIKLQQSGKLKDYVDIDFVFYFLYTSMFNMHMFFREKNITDRDKEIEIKRNFYTNILLKGILNEDKC